MSLWLVAAVGLVYLAVAVEQFFKGNMGMSIMFFGYAVANIGLCLSV